MPILVQVLVTLFLRCRPVVEWQPSVKLILVFEACLGSLRVNSDGSPHPVLISL
jgi:hypothetical protein